MRSGLACRHRPRFPFNARALQQRIILKASFDVERNCRECSGHERNDHLLVFFFLKMRERMRSVAQQADTSAGGPNKLEIVQC